MAPPTIFSIVLSLGLVLVLTKGAAVSGRVSQSFLISRPARASPLCERQMTSERGDVTVMSNTSAPQNCTYVIRPRGTATLYKLWFGDVTLNAGDAIDAWENQGQDPADMSVGPSNQGPPFVLFNTEIHVRVTTRGDGTTGHHARMYWAPVTVETVTSLECTDDVMRIRVNLTELRWLYNDTDPAEISLIDEGCMGRAVGDLWALDNPHSQCYTQRQTDRDFVHYRNALIYKEPGAGPIVREHRWRLDLRCNFRRQMQVGTDYSLQETKHYQIHVQSDYVAEIHVFNDSSLSSEVPSKQIRVQLGDDLYVKIDLKGDWNVTMHLQSCLARPLPTSPTSYTLIQQGCPTDSQTFILYTTHNSTLFHFKVFEFYTGSSSVYIDCDVAYCAPLDNGPRCGAVCH